MNDFSDWMKDFQKDEADWSTVAEKFNKKKFKPWLIAIGILFLALVVIGPIYSAVMEYWQLEEIGKNFTSLFFTNLAAQAVTGAVGFILAFVFIWCNLMAIKKFAIEPNFSAKFLTQKRWYFVLSLVISLVLGYVCSTSYQKLLLALNGETFGTVDPLFGKDVGYYIFVRPFLTSLVSGTKAVVLIFLILFAVAYFLIFLKEGHRGLKEIIKAEPKAFIHIVILGIFYFLLSVLTYQFSAEALLFSSFGAGGETLGAGYVATKIWKVFYGIAPYVVLVIIALTVFFLYRKKYMATLISLAAIPVIFLGVAIVGGLTDSLVVNPNERNVEMPYLAHNIAATNHAFGLDEVTEQAFVPNYDMTREQMEEDDTWMAGTRIADYGSTLTAYNQLQFLRKYYSFHDVDVAPYEINGDLNVVFLAAREMNKANVDTAAKSYANQRFRYTHGFGVVASPVNKVTSEGQPEFLIKNIPPVSTEGMPEITQPRIYFGELTNDYVIVGGDSKELDYSEGVEDVEFTYDGDAGIKLSPFKRFMFATYFADYRMLISGNIGDGSQLLLNRNVTERVKKVAPFIKLDADPYMIIASDGTLKWIVNGYTTSAYYPYAQKHTDGFNYIRNSVTAVVDAYNGDVELYITDPTDPIAQAYKKIYPDLFAGEELPETVASHIRVPEYLFKVQSAMYQRYHVQDAGQFYDKADMWDIASEKYSTEEIPMEPYYNIMNIDGEDEMVLMLPFVVQGKHNMVGLLVQRNSPEHYGELVLYRFPKNQTVYGPMQIESRIDNDPDISREMTLWSQGGSDVIRGNLLVVPFRDALLYVEPVYITSKNNASLPELKRIVVSYGDAVAMEPTLEEALRVVFTENQGTQTGEEPGADVPPEAPAPQDDLDQMIEEAIRNYDKMKESAGAGDWQSMGGYMDALGKQIEELRRHQNTTE